MDVLRGARLIRKSGHGCKELEEEEALRGKKIVVLYFSAQWCPPCRLFTPMLRDFYSEVRDDGVEVVFVSSDRSAEDMARYFVEAHGDWCAVDHGSEQAQKLKQRFNILAVPTVIVLRVSDGQVLTKEGRAAIQAKGPKAAHEWIKIS